MYVCMYVCKMKKEELAKRWNPKKKKKKNQKKIKKKKTQKKKKKKKKDRVVGWITKESVGCLRRLSWVVRLIRVVVTQAS